MQKGVLVLGTDIVDYVYTEPNTAPVLERDAKFSLPLFLLRSRTTTTTKRRRLTSNERYDDDEAYTTGTTFTTLNH
jgi:hypothetical protein